jgi:multisubunit Na+/H+ antiporter MnhG subunit
MGEFLVLSGTTVATALRSDAWVPLRERGTPMVLAIVLIVLAILLGLGGLLFTALKWLLIVAAVFLIAGIVAGFIGRGKTKTLR